jgi:hypothetical protein
MFRWRYGALPGYVVTNTALVMAISLAAASWQAVRDDRQADRLSARLAALQFAHTASAAAIQAAEPPDVVQTLPLAPSVAQVVQSLQREADREGAHVMSLQADDHPPTATALGHLDLILSIKAPFPSILIVIQQVLDRYPGATLRQVLVTPMASTVPAVPAAAAPALIDASAAPLTIHSEAHLTLAFWRRPLGVEAAAPGATELPASVAAFATPITSVIVPLLPASSVGASTLPPIAGAPSAARK